MTLMYSKKVLFFVNMCTCSVQFKILKYQRKRDISQNQCLFTITLKLKENTLSRIFSSSKTTRLNIFCMKKTLCAHLKYI